MCVFSTNNCLKRLILQYKFAVNLVSCYSSDTGDMFICHLVERSISSIHEKMELKTRRVRILFIFDYGSCANRILCRQLSNKIVDRMFDTTKQNSTMSVHLDGILNRTANLSGDSE